MKESLYNRIMKLCVENNMMKDMPDHMYDDYNEHAESAYYDRILSTWRRTRFPWFEQQTRKFETVGMNVFRSGGACAFLSKHMKFWYTEKSPLIHLETFEFCYSPEYICRVHIVHQIQWHSSLGPSKSIEFKTLEEVEQYFDQMITDRKKDIKYMETLGIHQYNSSLPYNTSTWEGGPD